MSTETEFTKIEAAREIAAEIHRGKWRHVTGLGSLPPFKCDEVVAEFRSRCPGLERGQYEDYLAKALEEHRRPSIGKSLRYWFVALTFVWALLVVPVVVKRLFGGMGESWLGLCAYPLMCGIAAALLLRRRDRSGLFASLNVASGLAWVVFVVWAVRAFARNFWR